MARDAYAIPTISHFQYEKLSLRYACLRYSVFSHVPHHEYFKQTSLGFRTKHFVWTTLKNSLPTKFAVPVLAIFKQARNLKKEKTTETLTLFFFFAFFFNFYYSELGFLSLTLFSGFFESLISVKWRELLPRIHHPNSSPFSPFILFLRRPSSSAFFLVLLPLISGIIKGFENDKSKKSRDGQKVRDWNTSYRITLWLIKPFGKREKGNEFDPLGLSKFDFDSFFPHPLSPLSEQNFYSA